MAISNDTRFLPANSTRRALALLGDRWTLLILRDAFLGVRQFGQWEARLGVTPTVLTRRLKHLVEAGILHRERVRGVPPRVDYHLTAKGLDIYPVALMILRWEQRWFHDDATIVLRHLRCGAVTEPRLSCGHCGGDVVARAVSYADGPGAGLDAALEERRRRTATTAEDGAATHGFLEHAVDILGDRWSWEIVGAAFLGCRRFDDIAAMTGMASNILSDRLRRLTDDEILARRAYQERPLRHDYALTAKGRDLYGATVMLLRFGDRWLAGDKGPPLVLTHTVCGGTLAPRVTCSACGEVLEAREAAYERR